MPCPRDAVTSFPCIFLYRDCSPNQDGDAAHYKLVRQRLCALSRDSLSGSLASLPLPRTPGQQPQSGASLLGLSALFPRDTCRQTLSADISMAFTNAKPRPCSEQHIEPWMALLGIYHAP
jgi:hypothetical protein